MSALDPQEFANSFQKLVEWAEQNAGAGDAAFETLLSEHFEADPSEYPVVTEKLGSTDLPNLQLALTAYLERDGVDHQLTGVAGPIEHEELSLIDLVHGQAWGVRKGPVRRRVIQLDRGVALSCVVAGLYLVHHGGLPLAILIAPGFSHLGQAGVQVEVMAEEEARAEELVGDLRELMAEHNVYRGKVLTLDGGGDFGEEDMAVQFRAVPDVPRDAIVLPSGVLDLVELHTVEFTKHAEKLLAGGRHLRRGILLHGPPGTGKTLTVSHLIGRMEGRTVLILSGNALGLIAEACQLAKELAPSMVVLEDVDLVASERMMGDTTSLLFELMNQIDGIGPDTDVIFMMTTNRAEILEPALAARPGRVDQAVEIPLPDESARRQLLDLYCQGLDARLSNPDPVIFATDGVSAAFIRELVRKAALVAARDGSDTVTDEHFSGALNLLEQGGGITRSMLGGDGGAAAGRLGEDDFADEDDDWDEE